MSSQINSSLALDISASSTESPLNSPTATLHSPALPPSRLFSLFSAKKPSSHFSISKILSGDNSNECNNNSVAGHKTVDSRKDEEAEDNPSENVAEMDENFCALMMASLNELMTLSSTNKPSSAKGTELDNDHVETESAELTTNNAPSINGNLLMAINTMMQNIFGGGVNVCAKDEFKREHASREATQLGNGCLNFQIPPTVLAKQLIQQKLADKKFQNQHKRVEELIELAGAGRKRFKSEWEPLQKLPPLEAVELNREQNFMFGRNSINALKMEDTGNGSVEDGEEVECASSSDDDDGDEQMTEKCMEVDEVSTKSNKKHQRLEDGLKEEVICPKSSSLLQQMPKLQKQQAPVGKKEPGESAPEQNFGDFAIPQLFSAGSFRPRTSSSLAAVFLDVLAEQQTKKAANEGEHSEHFGQKNSRDCIHERAIKLEENELKEVVKDFNVNGKASSRSVPQTPTKRSMTPNDDIGKKMSADGPVADKQKHQLGININTGCDSVQLGAQFWPFSTPLGMGMSGAAGQQLQPQFLQQQQQDVAASVAAAMTMFGTQQMQGAAMMAMQAALHQQRRHHQQSQQQSQQQWQHRSGTMAGSGVAPMPISFGQPHSQHPFFFSPTGHHLATLSGRNHHFSSALAHPLSHRGHPLATASSHKRKGGQIRFNNDQTDTLEGTFIGQRYLSNQDRKVLAKKLNLSERQVKTWFQNRRAKWRRMRKEDEDDDDDCVGLERHQQGSRFSQPTHLEASSQIFSSEYNSIDIADMDGVDGNVATGEQHHSVASAVQRSHSHQQHQFLFGTTPFPASLANNFQHSAASMAQFGRVSIDVNGTPGSIASGTLSTIRQQM